MMGVAVEWQLDPKQEAMIKEAMGSLVAEAIREHGMIEMCGGRKPFTVSKGMIEMCGGRKPFTVSKGMLVFWFNLPSRTTKILSRYIPGLGDIPGRIGMPDFSTYSRKSIG